MRWSVSPKSQLEELVAEKGEPKFRAKQLYGWIYKGISDFREMKNLPEIFLRNLRGDCVVGDIKMEKRRISSLDGTEKFLFALNDGNNIKSARGRTRFLRPRQQPHGMEPAAQARLGVPRGRPGRHKEVVGVPYRAS